MRGKWRAISRWRAISLLVLLWAAGISIALADGQGGLKKVTFIPQWQPQAQFAGYYVGLDKGFYAKHGIDLTILRGGPDMEPSRLLSEGQADFGTFFLSSAIQKRAQGMNLVNVSQMVQCSSLMLIAKKSSGIYAPQDMDGKRVGLWGPEFQMQARAFFKNYQLEVNVIPQAATVNLFLRGGVDVASGMWYNEYHMILNAGVDPDELTTFFFFDHGMNFPEDGIYCLAPTFDRNPDLCHRFVQASIEGWRYAFDHPKEALDVVMKYVEEANVATDRAHQKWMLERMQDIMANPRCGISESSTQAAESTKEPKMTERMTGLLDEADYQRVAIEIKKAGLIDSIPSFSDFFKGMVPANEK